MKKTIFLSLLGFFAVFLFSCREESGSKLLSLSYADTYYLSSDTSRGAFRISIQMEFPAGHTENDSLIRSSLVSLIFGENYLRLSNDSLLPAYAADMRQEYRLDNEPLLQESKDEDLLYPFNNEHTIEGFSLLNDQNIFSYGLDRYAFMGGAHGLEIRSYYNFDLKAKHLITEADLFTQGYQSELTTLLRTKINEDNKAMFSEKELKELDYWVDSIKPNGNFYISDEAITYVFNPYEIAPYYMGHTEVVLPFNRLASLLKTDSPIAYLIEKSQK